MTVAVVTRRTRTPAIGSAAWHAQRRLAIFATDAAPAANLSRFSDPVMLYLDKLGLTATKVELERMKWGKVLEAPIAHEWARIHKRKVRREPMTWYRDGLGFPMGSHLDYWAGDELVEIKTANQYMTSDFGEDHTDQVPIDYRLQMVHELAVTGADKGHLIVLIGGQRLGQYLIERDLETEQSLLTIEGDLWDHVQTRTPPDVDGGEGSKALLALIEADDALQIEVDDALEDLATSYLAATAQEIAAHGSVEGIKNRIKATLGAATRAKGRGFVIQYTRNKPSSEIAWENVATAYRVMLGDAMAEILRLDPHIQHPDGTGFDPNIAGVIPANTSTKQGNRPLLVKLREA